MRFRLPLRPRLFVKKRGSRRTSDRGTGMLTEALVFSALIAAGGYGVYWLIDGMLLAEGSRHGWWLWLALIIPGALIGYGITGLATLLWQNLASTERRAAAVRKATDWETLVGQTKPQRLDLPAVPLFGSVIESAGVRLAYRLPIDAATGWISFTVTAVCIVWNTLVLFFLYHVVQQHIVRSPSRWLLTWLIVPFVMAGVWTLVALVRQVILDIIVGTTRVEVSNHPFYPAGKFQGFVSQTGRSHVRWYQVHIVCDEQAVYQQGTDTRRDSRRVYQHQAFSQRKFDITPQQAFETAFDIEIPDSAMHSFESNHNAVTWAIVVRGRMARWGEFERRFPIYVYPVRIVEPAAMAPLVAAAKG
jgi:hypothetical protein